MYPLKTPTNKDFSYRIPGTEHIQRNYVRPTVILTEEKDHSTLRQQLSFKNTFPILAQQSSQHWRTKRQLCSTQRNRHTGKSSRGARGSTVTIYVLLRRDSLGHRWCRSFREFHRNFFCANVKAWGTWWFTKITMLSGSLGWASTHK